MVELSASRPLSTGTLNGVALLPGAPTTWSFSSLDEVEACPRRYVLRRADYPAMWSRHGYPPLPVPAALKGNIIHGAVEVILTAFSEANCSSIRSAEAVAVLRRLGGYTAVAERLLHAQVSRFDGNPRVGPESHARLVRLLTDWLPEARGQIQSFLNRVKVSPSQGSATKTTGAPGAAKFRHAVREGSHPEQQLVADALRLRGQVDLLVVDSGCVQITDFKTGAESPKHREQLQFYALLWNADASANPERLPITSLVAAYARHDIEVPVPDTVELARLRVEIEARTWAADNAVVAELPVARVGAQCITCDVRGVCSEYWEAPARTSEVPSGSWFDLSGVVVREHGVKSWALREANTGDEVLIRTSAASVTLPVGTPVRLLGVQRRREEEEGDALIVALTSTSEVIQLE